MPSVIRSLVLLPAFFSTLVRAVHPVVVRGQDFVDSVTNQRHQIIGVDYQPGGQSGYKPQEGKDVLTNADVCLRDATIIQKLGVNTIRVYNIDPSLDHSACASIFNAAGIYMIIDVNSPLQGESLDRTQPWTSYNKDYMSRIFGVVENFKIFPNTLGFFAANEVMNDDPNNAVADPQYIRAVQRDLKNYIKKHVSRTIPVGYSAADVRPILQDTWAYLQCNNQNDGSSSDFLGLNSYSWCGNATFQSSGYVDLVNMFNQSAIPVFFSEYGCNLVQPRIFTEVEALYGNQMTALSGGLVYEYSEEEENYGLVILNSNGSVSLKSDYNSLQTEYNKVDVNLAQTATAQSSQVKAPDCNSNLISSANFDKNFTIPAVCPGCQDLIDNGISNATNGKLTSVTETQVKQAVYDVNGVQIQNVTLSVLPNDEANTPGGKSLSPNSTGSAPQPKPNKKGDAERLGKSRWVWMCLLVGVMLL